MPAHMIAHSQRLRFGRFSEPGRIYLLTTQVHGREPLFADFNLGRMLVGELRAAHEQGWVDSLAWVLMPDHLHWLVRLEAHSLEQLLRRVKTNSARRINQRLGRTGRVWQAGYHDRALRQDEDLQAAARYIVANPLRARLVARLGDYPHWDAVWL